MKKWIHAKQKIYGMSLDRGKAKKRIEDLSDIILEHICKCILYGDSTHDYHHWIYEEVSNWLYYINRITVKPRDKKLKVRDYADFIFGGFGDDMADAELNLNLEYNKCRRANPPYPEVKITNDMVKSLFNITRDLKSSLPALLAAENNLVKEDIGALVESVLNRYCK